MHLSKDRLLCVEINDDVDRVIVPSSCTDLGGDASLPTVSCWDSLTDRSCVIPMAAITISVGMKAKSLNLFTY